MEEKIAAFIALLGLFIASIVMVIRFRFGRWRKYLGRMPENFVTFTVDATPDDVFAKAKAFAEQRGTIRALDADRRRFVARTGRIGMVAGAIVVVHVNARVDGISAVDFGLFSRSGEAPLVPGYGWVVTTMIAPARKKMLEAFKTHLGAESTA